MPHAATQQRHGGGKHGQGEAGQHHGGGAVIPFHRASYRYREKIRTDTVVATNSAQSQVPIQITPGGFLAGVWMEVTGTGGVLNTAVLGSPTDHPFAYIQTIQIEDVGGGTIYGPTSGYTLYLANKYGGYFEQSDPVIAASFSALFTGQNFVLFVPLQIRSDALGSLSNTDARSQYRLVYTVDGSTNITSTGTFTSHPTLTITTWVDYWAQVEAQNLQGEPQEQTPPYLNTTQFWSREIPVVAASAQTIKHNRVGNQIRELIYVLRNGAAAGAAQPANQRVNNFTDPIKIRLDNRYLMNGESPNLRRALMSRDFNLGGADGDPAGAIGTPTISYKDTGVLVYPFNKDAGDKPGPGDDADWLDTNEAQLLQFEDTLNATVATLEIVTNDIAVRAPAGALAAPQ